MVINVGSNASLKDIILFYYGTLCITVLLLGWNLQRSWLGVKLRRFDDLNAAAAWIFIIHNLRGPGQK